MKKFLNLILAFFICLFITLPTFAENFYIKNYEVNIDVNNTNNAHITETIDTYFTINSHGIIRSIPTKNDEITNIFVNENYKVVHEDNNYLIKIGSPDLYIKGNHTYKISYDYNFIDHNNEFYFNIIGTDWNTKINHVSFNIKLPMTIDRSKVGLSVGKYGSKGFSEGAKYTIMGNMVKGEIFRQLEPNEGVTIRIKYPEEHVSKNNIDYEAEEYSIANYTAAINKAPKGSYEQAENYAYRALEYMLVGNYQSAVSDATKSIQIGFDKNKYDFVDWALNVYYTRALSYQNLKIYPEAIQDYTTYIQKANKIRKYSFNSHIELLLGNCYYLRATAKLEQMPLYRSKIDGKMVRYANMHNDMLQIFNDLEAAIKIYSSIDSIEAKEKKVLAERLLSNLKAAYYK